MSINCLSHSCVGQSHNATGKPCQDASFAEVSDDLAIAVVCDGHGGERYFRSDVGSRAASEITAKSVKEFVAHMPQSPITPSGKESVFAGIEFGAYGPDGEDNDIKFPKVHEALQWLFSSIISQWNAAINAHAFSNPLSEWEKEHVDRKYLDEFTSMIESGDTAAGFEKTYGCTLMAYVRTKTYWFAFHIGDGKCLMFKDSEHGLDCTQPIPWDERCFLNKTTSLCDTSAIENFRYCFQGNGEFPLAVFLGSDGMDDSYGDGDNLTNFYIQVFKMLLNKGKDYTLDELKKSLPKISEVGSKDDMSVAAVYDDADTRGTFLLLTDYQMARLVQDSNDLQAKLEALEQKIAGFGPSPDSLSESDRIELQYAQSSAEKVREQLARNKRRTTVLKCEVTKFKNKN